MYVHRQWSTHFLEKKHTTLTRPKCDCSTMVPGTLLRAYYRRRPRHGVGPEECTYLAERRRSRRRRRRSRPAAPARTCRTWGTAPPESARPRPLPFPAGSDLAGQRTPWRPLLSQQAPPRHRPRNTGSSIKNPQEARRASVQAPEPRRSNKRNKRGKGERL
jgi:hypothetical protein